MHYCSNRHVRSSCGRGFSLIELLVVMAVIGLLVVIGSSAHSRVTMLANQSQCASNMRQIGVAVFLFANARGGQLPDIAGHGNDEGSWVRVLAPYLDKVNEIRISPADPDREKKLKLEEATSYVANNLLFGAPQDRFGRPTGPPRSLQQLQEPARTRLFFNVADGKGFALQGDHIHGVGWTSWSRILVDISPDFHRVGRRSADRTSGSSNILFADGRVDIVPAVELKTLVDRGINPALPPEGL